MKKKDEGKDRKETEHLVAGLDNPHYIEIRKLIDAKKGLPDKLYNERYVGPNGTRPLRFNKASFSAQ